MDPDKRSAWLQKLDAECPYQVVLPRRPLTDDSEIVNFLLSHAGKFDMYVEDEAAAYVRYCFKDPMDAAIFRSRFEPKSEPSRLAGRALIPAGLAEQREEGRKPLLPSWRSVLI